LVRGISISDAAVLKFQLTMKKRVVCITGAGRGLGRAIAETFRKQGFEVIATDIDEALLSEVKETKRITTYKLDVTSEKSTAGCARLTEDKFGRLDVLISCAGIVDYYPLSEAGADKLKKIFDVNTFGLINLTKYFLPLLIKSSGRLIVISSESHKVPAPFQPYSVSKQALENIYNSIRLELLTKNVKTILIRPGAIQTGILQDTLNFDYPLTNSAFTEEFKHFGQSISKYIGKAADPEDVAKVILKAATASHPKRTYRINHNPIVSLLSFLPVKWKDTLIRKNLSKNH